MPTLEGLADADLLALRLAAQVLRHKAALAGRPLVARWFEDLGRAVDSAMARHGVGFVVGEAPTLALPREADESDRAMLVDHLRLVATNPALSPALRAACAELRETVSK